MEKIDISDLLINDKDIVGIIKEVYALKNAYFNTKMIEHKNHNRDSKKYSSTIITGSNHLVCKHDYYDPLRYVPFNINENYGKRLLNENPIKIESLKQSLDNIYHNHQVMIEKKLEVMKDKVQAILDTLVSLKEIKKKLLIEQKNYESDELKSSQSLIQKIFHAFKQSKILNPDYYEKKQKEINSKIGIKEQELYSFFYAQMYMYRSLLTPYYLKNQSPEKIEKTLDEMISVGIEDYINNKEANTIFNKKVAKLKKNIKSLESSYHKKGDEKTEKNLNNTKGLLDEMRKEKSKGIDSIKKHVIDGYINNNSSLRIIIESLSKNMDAEGFIFNENESKNLAILSKKAMGIISKVEKDINIKELSSPQKLTFINTLIEQVSLGSQDINDIVKTIDEKFDITSLLNEKDNISLPYNGDKTWADLSVLNEENNIYFFKNKINKQDYSHTYQVFKEEVIKRLKEERDTTNTTEVEFNELKPKSSKEFEYMLSGCIKYIKERQGKEVVIFAKNTGDVGINYVKILFEILNYPNLNNTDPNMKRNFYFLIDSMLIDKTSDVKKCYETNDNQWKNLLLKEIFNEPVKDFRMNAKIAFNNLSSLDINPSRDSDKPKERITRAKI